MINEVLFVGIENQNGLLFNLPYGSFLVPRGSTRLEYAINECFQLNLNLHPIFIQNDKNALK